MRGRVRIGTVVIGLMCLGAAVTPVQDEKTAISIGQDSCRGATAAEAFFKSFPKDQWHAHLYDDVWFVWFGERIHGHAFMEVEVVRADGKATDCVIWA